VCRKRSGAGLPRAAMPAVNRRGPVNALYPATAKDLRARAGPDDVATQNGKASRCGTPATCGMIRRSAARPRLSLQNDTTVAPGPDGRKIGRCKALDILHKNDCGSNRDGAAISCETWVETDTVSGRKDRNPGTICPCRCKSPGNTSNLVTGNWLTHRCRAWVKPGLVSLLSTSQEI
jgi:hypothetical protein